MQLYESLEKIKNILTEIRTYDHAVGVLSYDQQTICPPEGKAEQGEIMAFLSNRSFELKKDEEFIRAALDIFEHRDELDELDRRLAVSLHRNYLREKNITPEMDYEFSLVFNRSFVNWEKAKQQSDFSLFKDSLAEVIEVCTKIAQLKEYDEGCPVPDLLYDRMLDNYENGLNCRILDECFEKCKKRLIPLLKAIQNSPKKIRTDFLTRTVTDEQQKKMAEFLLGTMNFDLNRGAFTTSEHPFTDGMGRNDIRITTNYDPNLFISNIYSIIHEAGHALFEMNQPAEDYDHFIEYEKTMGMHESVSRFYENRLGRSRAFVSYIYPRVKEIFSEAMADVSETELYEALNIVQPSLIRTDADEFTYIFHIIIRYELEKEIVAGNIKVEDIPAAWNEKYREYLGITPPGDREGVLQDVHWSGGFGYFPTYSLGDMYDSMYLNVMKKELDVDADLAAGDFSRINLWMKEHVFKLADRLDPEEWIMNITGRSLTADDFLDYLEEKYSKLYELK